MPYKNPPPCQVCGKPSAARRLCDKHYRRFKKHGDAEATLRPGDWGERSSHPLADRWAWTARTREGRVPRWDDLWLFVEDVGVPPSSSHLLRRLDKTSPWGPTNFCWKELVQSQRARDDLAAYQRAWRAKNRLRSKAFDLKKHYGITLEQYHEILEAQGGGCAICGGQDDRRVYLSVDHCHETKRIRGLLCGPCNRALGGFKDDPSLLLRAAAYAGGD